MKQDFELIKACLIVSLTMKVEMLGNGASGCTVYKTGAWFYVDLIIQPSPGLASQIRVRMNAVAA